MPNISNNPLPLPGSFVPLAGEGLIKIKDLDYSEDPVTADQQLWMARLAAAGLNGIVSVSHSGNIGDALTIGRIDGTIEQLSVGSGTHGGQAATANLYWGATAPPTTLPQNLAQTDLDAMMTQTNINGDIQINIDTPAMPARDDWSTWIIVTDPHRITYINEGFGDATSSWTEFTGEDIGGTTYNGRYVTGVVGDGTFRLTIRVS